MSQTITDDIRSIHEKYGSGVNAFYHISRGINIHFHDDLPYLKIALVKKRKREGNL